MLPAVACREAAGSAVAWGTLAQCPLACRGTRRGCRALTCRHPQGAHTGLSPELHIERWGGGPGVLCGPAAQRHLG